MANSLGAVFPTKTAAQWAALNPLLMKGQGAFEEDTRALKVGDGSTLFNDLPYFIGARTEASSEQISDVIDSMDLVTQAAADLAYVGTVNAPKDGSTPALAAFQAAITAAAGRPLFVPPGDYLFNDSLTGRANLTFAPGARILQSVNKPAFELTGTGSQGQSSRGLQSTAAAGQNIINCNTVGLVVGDWILVRSAEVFPNSVAGSKIGELHRVRQIDGTTQLRTLSNLDYTYAPTTSSVVKFGMMQGVRLLGAGEFINTLGENMKVPMLRFTACADLVVDASVVGAGGPGVTVSADTLFSVRARVRDSFNNEDNGNFGYGVETFGASCHGDVHVDMVGGRHAFTTTSGSTTASVPRHINVTGTAEGLTNTAWDSHEEGEFIHFKGVKAFGCRNGAIKHRAPRSTITDPIVRNCLGIGVRFAPSAFGGALHGGDMREIRYLSEGSPGVGVQIEAPGVTVSGEPRIECDDQTILVLAGGSNSRIRSGTLLPGARGNADTRVAIEYQGVSSSHRVDRGVSIETPALVGVKAAATATDVRVAPLRYEGVATRVSGAIHLVTEPPRRRLINVPGNGAARSSLSNVTSGRAYISPLVVEDDEPWTTLIPTIGVATAAAAGDTVEVAIYDTARNRLATTGKQAILDTTGVKTLPGIAFSPLLGKRYLLVTQFVLSGATLVIHAGGFSNTVGAAMAGNTDETYDGGYVAAANPLPAQIASAPVVGAISVYPWVQLTTV
ncbi:tail spike protein [Gordonia phage Buggaboo]|uniref:Tailspike protein n=1 Tax=Gordonia phage Buggaboo TaxID=2315529 RepID=A0A386KDA7_9CAUD|nr:tail spike protein [Gordonia phage Buggaboo]AVE00680.1 tailspike protein [Gordonia phage SuperSulley]AYD83214.1 tailspike protein [Gordonia phage Buggaboo]